MSSSRKSSKPAKYVDPYKLVNQLLADGANASDMIMGLDLSLRRTGVALIWTSKGEWDFHTLLIEPPVELREGGRLMYIERELRRLVDAFEPNFAALEGYSYGSLTGQFQLGEVGGLARLVLAGSNTPYVVVPPTTLKKYVTGSGNANKIAMALQLNKELDITLYDDNEVDALCLAALGAHIWGTDLLQFTRNAERDKLAEDVKSNPTGRAKTKKKSKPSPNVDE